MGTADYLWSLAAGLGLAWWLINARRKREEPNVVPGRILRTLSKGEAAPLVEQWWDVFGRPRHANYFLWHVFSGGDYPCLRGDAARETYGQHLAPEYIVLWMNREALVTDLPPPPESYAGSDFYVFPPNLAWTMAFTHEDGDPRWPSGPYFARHPDYGRLNEENRAAVEKLHQAEAAKLKGQENERTT